MDPDDPESFLEAEWVGTKDEGRMGTRCGVERRMRGGVNTQS